MARQDNADYLGDGVYVSFDGYQIWLYANSLYSHERVAIEPPVFERLLEYAKRIPGYGGTSHG